MSLETFLADGVGLSPSLRCGREMRCCPSLDAERRCEVRVPQSGLVSGQPSQRQPRQVLLFASPFAGCDPEFTGDESLDRLKGYDQNRQFNYSQGKLTTRYSYNAGAPGSPLVSGVFAYFDPSRRLSSQTTMVAGGSSPNVTQNWLYNSLGLVSQHAHSRPSGAPFIVNAIYSQGLPTAVYANGLPVVTGVTYQPSGALGSYTTGPGIGLNIATTIAPDTSGMPRPSRISAQPVGPYPNLFDTFSYSYDGAGNITGMGSDAFTYDARSRLCQALVATAGATQYYTYDRYGNLVTKGFTQPPPPSPCLSTSSWANNRVPTATYDLGVPNGRGNLTSYAASSYSYDGLDRQVAASGWTYLFDGASERVAKYNGAWTYTFRDEGNRLSTEFAGSAPSRDNVFLGSLLVASFADPAVGGNGRVWTFYSSDHLGTPRLLTDVAGNLIETRQSWPYGEDISVPSASQRIRFASMERDTEAPAYHDHARNHEFNLGRFLTVDTLEGRIDVPQSWNRYAYSSNNPLRHVDPNGRQSVDLNSKDPNMMYLSGQINQQQLASRPWELAPLGAVAGAMALAFLAPPIEGILGPALLNMVLSGGASALLSEPGERAKGGIVGGAVGFIAGVFPAGRVLTPIVAAAGELLASQATEGKPNLGKATLAFGLSLLTRGEVNAIGVGKYGGAVLDNANAAAGGLFFLQPPQSSPAAFGCGSSGFIGPCQPSTK